MENWITLIVFLGTSLFIVLVCAMLNRENLRILTRVRRLSIAS